ncbi:MAG: PaaI family thioesterase [Deltaproteobacteria bacterium]|jgi:uncharacterized protein (TIGR00369 family)|nr:PaaI family thioesterase [Deltaproteobacteria bacterium]
MKNAYLAALCCADQNVNPLFNFLGARMTEASEGRAVIELPVSGRLAQGGGVVAGGILATLADESMAHAVISILEEGRLTVTTEMNIRYLRAVDPAGKGMLYGKARVIKPGRSIIVAEAEVRDEADRLIATAGGSFFVIEAKTVRL